MEKNFLTRNTRPTTCLEILYCLLLLASPHLLWSQATVTCNSTNDRITIAISNAQAQQAGCPVAANYQVTSTTASNGSTVFYVSNESPVSGGVSTAFTDVYVEGPLVDVPFTIGASVFNDANQACTITISPLSGTSCFSADPPNLDDLPVVGIPCYVNGDRDLSTTEDEAFILVTYRPNEGMNSLGGGADIFTLARDEQVGTTWGVAYNQTSSAYYTSATLKRHSDLGPGGTGAIYRVTGEIDTDGSLINNTVTTLIDLNADPNVNTGAAPTNRGLGTANDPSADANAYNMVGRIGIGDIDMLPDNNTLVAININTTGGNTPQLVFINVSDESSAAVTKVVPINATTTGVGCSNGTLVPWGIGIDEATGEIYVGAVCNADGIGATRADLFGYVLKYDPTNDTFDEALEISLDFGRSNPAVGGDVRADWQTWRNDNTYAPRVLDAFFDVDPQPIIADIEFLDNGDMMVGLVDRFGFQTGSSQQKPDGTPTGALGGADAERGRPAGGLMRFFPNAAAPGTWVVPADNQLFAYSDVASGPENAAALGGIAYFNGQNLNELLAPTVDPSSANTNGLVLINLAPGRPAFPINRASDPGYQLDVQDLLLTPSGGTEPRTIEKGQGLGDLELGILNPTCILSDADFNCTGSDAGGTTITLNPVRNEAGTSGTYSVSVPAGFSVANNDGISGTMGNYGAVVTFTVTPALSTGQQIVVTITDTDVGNCEITANLSETDCGAPPCSITGSIVSQTCDEGDPNNETDDEYDFVVTATLTNGTSTLYDVLVDGSPLSPPVTVASGTNATFSLPATAGPSTVAISFRDADDFACVSPPVTSGDLMECSTPVACSATAVIGTSNCDDNGTPSNPSDDTFNLFVQGVLANTTSTTYNAYYTPNTGGAVETPFPGNPYPVGITASVTLAADGTTVYNVRVENADDPTCTNTDGPVTAPASCSDECLYDVELIRASVCSDGNYELRIVLAYANTTSNDIDIIVDGVLAGTHTLGDDNVRPGVDSFVVVNPAVLVCGQGLATYDITVGDPTAPACSTEGEFETAPIDPAGYIYCIENGKIILGGTLEVTDVAAGTSGTTDFGNVNFGDRGNPTPADGSIPNNGTRGTYNWEVLIPGSYIQAYTPPAGYAIVPARVEAGSLDPTGENDPYSIGSTASGDGMDSTFLLDFSETGNVYFESFNLNLGDPFVINNNVPLMSLAAIISVESSVSVCTYNATEGRSETTVTVVVDYTGVPEGEVMRVAAMGGTPLNGSMMERVINGQNGQQTFEFVMRSDGTQDVQFNVDFAPTDCSNTVGMTMIDLPESCCPTDETISVCNDGTTSATFTPPTGLIDLVWVVEGSNDTLENSDEGVTIDPATFEITVDATAPGFVTDTLRLIYRATDPANNACSIELCCPVLVAIKPCVSLGSTVFTDPNNDGMYDETVGSPETGVMGVTLVLVDPGPDMMVGGGDDVFVDTTMTDGNGDYLFSGLDTGNYYVLIPANENFDPGDPLAMFIQSSGPTDEMDNGEDGDDNGIQNGGAGMDVVSPVVDLQTGQEATDAGNGGRTEIGSGSMQDNVDLVDADGDMTLDFGFLAEVIDVALTKTLVTSSLGANMVADLNELVEFQITVINQGTDSLNATSVVDYIPAGYTFNQANNPNFTGTTAGTGAAAGYELATYDFDFTADPLAPGASAPISIFLNVTGRVPDSSGYINIAEVTSITDDNGMDRSNDDIDSTPDTDPTDDPGGVVGGDSDDETMGDGTGGGGTPGVDDENADEDDADPATVPLIDVALIKVIDPASLGANGTADNNEIIEFDITVVNQGTESVSQIAVIDSIPCGFAFTLAGGGGIPGNVGVWTGNNFAATATIAGPLRPGASATLTLFLRVRPGLARCNNVNNGVLDLTNEAEVTSLVRDADGSTQQTDFDSNFDETDGDEDGGGIPNMNSDNVVLGNGTGTDGSDDPLTDDDDHDRATTEKIDVALIKFIDTLDVNTGTGPYSIGDLIKFDIRLYNQGNVPINDIDVIDYLPDGLGFDAAGNDGVGENTGGVAWTLGLDGNARTTFAGLIPTGDSAVVSIFLTVGSSTGDPAIDYLNRAEVYEIDAETTNQTTGVTMEVEGLTQDADSPLNENPDDDTGGVVNTPDDNNNQGGGPSEGEDQDNADPALVNVSQLSLGSTVFIDANNNGVQDAGEMGVPNVPLILLDSNGDPIDIGADGLLGTSDDNGGDVYTTDGDGNYFFGNLNPGDYSVQIPATAFDPGGPLADFPISSNETSSGFMEEDPDGTDAADPADDVDGDDNGRQPGGSGTVVDTDPITLSVGEEPTTTETFQGGDQDDTPVDENGNMTLDLSFFSPVSVGDTAFVDVNMDGFQDGGDLPLPNALVTIIDVTTGLPVDTDAEGNPYDAVRMTGPDGSYLFDSLPPGNYQVIFDITDADNSEFYVYTTPNAGDDTDDSDVTPATPEGRTGTTDETGFLNSGESDLTLDAGVVCNLVVTVADPFTVCSTQPIDLTDGASITPLSLGGTWDNNGGDGTFDGGTDFATATTYTPGPLDVANGSVTLTLTTNEPPLASGCEPASASVTVTILQVDCGQFMWDGGN